MDGPYYLILLTIFSDPMTGMSRGGMRGIREILITGMIFSDSILWRGHQPGKHYGQNFYNKYPSRPGGRLASRIPSGHGGKGDRGGT